MAAAPVAETKATPELISFFVACNLRLKRNQVPTGGRPHQGHCAKS